MASLIPGYNYDIFISYRQKDNKYDGWVTEFVDNLKHELESMFKEDVSVYFDINPSDYLLESYDVDASLKDKLKCLIFIPIVSRTYCDPKSFAWDNELKAFVHMASEDRFSFKVKLPNGNVANRVLPIRIHDLETADIKLFESVAGGVMRSIDFVYKETGVNRQLRAKDDDILIKAHGQNLYRDQINKVALAIKEIIESMKLHTSPEKSNESDIKVKESIKIEEDVTEKIIQPKNEIKSEKIVKENGKRYLKFRKSKILLPGIIIILVILSGLFFLIDHHSKVKWAKEEALPQIEKFYEEVNMSDAFDLEQKAEKYIPEDPKLKEFASLIIRKVTILTDPPGANVYFKEYSDSVRDWKFIGTTPIDTMKFPNFTFYQIKLEKSGYENVNGVTVTTLDTLFRKLFKTGTIPEGMIYVEGYNAELKNNFLKENHGFFMDRFEVTNKQYKEFVDKGGYSHPDYWKNDFNIDGKNLKWKEAMTFFTDKAGRPGPATWEGGVYPEGQDDYPVSGVSWYEAAAYAEFKGKSLPTSNHWNSGAGRPISDVANFFNSRLGPISNFNGKGPIPVGKSGAINTFGAYDMAGNIREWCFNDTKIGRIIRGGAYNDVSYMYGNISQLPPSDRSPKNGFRCVQYIDKGKIPTQAFGTIQFTEARDVSKEIPVNDDIFKGYKSQFLYDKNDLKAIIEKRDESNDYCTVEKISFNAAYENERMIAYLFLPKNLSPPYQTVIFFPGSYARSETDLLSSTNSKWFIDFILKNGRALMYPVYKGTYERNITDDFKVQSHQFTNRRIKMTQDLSRSIDYLETRSEIDSRKLCYYGHSWGGTLGFIIPAVEERLKLEILVVGGNRDEPLPEADPLNYLPRIKIPVLMMNGKFDVSFPLETAVKPYFKLFGTPDKDKSLILYETDHYVPGNEMIKETLNWLDKYFGPIYP